MQQTAHSGSGLAGKDAAKSYREPAMLLSNSNGGRPGRLKHAGPTSARHRLAGAPRAALRALADAPDAFASTLEKETALPEQVWRQRAKGGPASVSFIAWEGGDGIGLAAIFAVDDAPERMHLVGMWVDPRHRRRGVARALVERAVRWAEQRQAREVILWVADHNTAARMLYERVGFRPTGQRQPLPSNPILSESLLRLPLTRPTSGL
jgi:ribosomal protein S18 acetylase RimI-like enzyme